jgi:flagellar assembly protein FliH
VAYIKPFTPQEAAVEALYQSTVGVVSSKIVRDAEAATLPVRLFTLFESPFPPAPSTAAEPVITQDVVAQIPLAQTEEEARDGRGEAEDLLQARQQEAMALLQQAQEAAAHCLAEARDQAAALQAQRYTEGFRQGEEAGRQAMVAQYVSVVTGFQRATEELTRLREEVLRQAEDDIVTLAFYLARRVLHQEVSSHRDTLATTLRQALAHVVDLEQVTVRLNPADLERAAALQPDLLQTVEGLRLLTLEGDETVGPGGCVVVSAFGEIDARLEAQLAELEQRFRAQYRLASEAHVA